MAGRRRFAYLIALVLAVAFGVPTPSSAQMKGEELIGRVCHLIENQSARNRLSPHFIARLLWKESRFNPNAVSPRGAEGIAQFMPATASRRGLADPFDVDQAIHASVSYLSDLQKRFGNLGLAAAAYNAGEARVSRWLSRGGFLPLETEAYVLGIFGQPVDRFIDATSEAPVQPLDPQLPFKEACMRLPVSAASVTAMTSVLTKPWGVHVAGNVRRDVAIRSWERLRSAHQTLLAAYEPVVSRIRAAHAPRGIYAVRLGAETRAEADGICAKLRSAHASCVVLRNR
ncbi:lytic transglycosylase domain-containing protein [Chelativorans salis]|nr:lytic transglycosylase domain-containing protein [Chelativorans sp. EGI FJ00035]